MKDPESGTSVITVNLVIPANHITVAAPTGSLLCFATAMQLARTASPTARARALPARGTAAAASTAA